MNKIASRTPSNESASYSTEEIENEEHVNQYDTDGSGHLNAAEFTKAFINGLQI